MALFATDRSSSPLYLRAETIDPFVYTPYGFHPDRTGRQSLLGFNGQPCNLGTRHYLLGNGYRSYNPLLMRFNSPDKTSPFGKGGLSAYGYCGSDPINNTDPSGLTFKSIIPKRLMSQTTEGKTTRKNTFNNALISEDNNPDIIKLREKTAFAKYEELELDQQKIDFEIYGDALSSNEIDAAIKTVRRMEKGMSPEEDKYVNRLLLQDSIIAKSNAQLTDRTAAKKVKSIRFSGEVQRYHYPPE